ncbi:hypothetical protein [Ectobacillus ponti]|uniref:Uncharacterized protein n=1 Tax=Ectobacillus ponti TaxID=2961894 RepID=A0AA41X8U3_9BACI|nr:hypothetical protein [Ectobacillus ponti]MCP8969243.1 hypothetical protein [Ectobacillus ponti]
MDELLLLEQWDVWVLLAIIGASYVAGKWSRQFCTRLPGTYASLHLLNEDTRLQARRQTVPLCVFDIRQRILCSVKHKSAPDGEEPSFLLL